MYNGAIEKKRERVTFFPRRRRSTRSLCMVCFLAKLKLKDERDELVDYSPRDITSKSKQTEALEVVAEANTFEAHDCDPSSGTDDQQATTCDGTVGEEDPEGAIDDEGCDRPRCLQRIHTEDSCYEGNVVKHGGEYPDDSSEQACVGDEGCDASGGCGELSAFDQCRYGHQDAEEVEDRSEVSTIE